MLSHVFLVPYLALRCDDDSALVDFFSNDIARITILYAVSCGPRKDAPLSLGWQPNKDTSLTSATSTEVLAMEMDISPHWMTHSLSRKRARSPDSGESGTENRPMVGLPPLVVDGSKEHSKLASLPETPFSIYPYQYHCISSHFNI